MVVSVVLRALLGRTGRGFSVWVVFLLVDGHVHLLNQEAVSRDTVSCSEQDNVTNDEVADGYTCRGAILASEDGSLLVQNFLSEVQELSFLSVITDRSNEGGKDDSEMDGDGLNPHVGVIRPEGEDEVERREDQEQLVEEVLELVPQDLQV